MLRRRVLQLFFNISYYYALLVGIFPTPLNAEKRNFRRSRKYIVYSAFIHCLMLSAVPFMFYFYKAHVDKFMQRDPPQPAMFWAYYITNTIQNVYMLLIFREAWTKRSLYRRTLRTYDRLARRLARYRDADTRGSSEQAYDEVTRRMERFLIYKFIVNGMCMSYTFVIMFPLHPHNNFRDLFLTVVNIQQGTIWLTPMTHFAWILGHLYREFAFINSALVELREQLLQDNGIDTRRSQHIAEQLNTLSRMHLKFYRLTTDILAMFNIPFAILLAQWFTANVRILQVAFYLVVGMLKWGFQAILYSIIMCVLYYWDSALVIVSIESVLAACNRTGSLLRDFNDIAQLQDNKQLERELETLASHGRCHELRYIVCGLFEFSKTASFGYFLAAVVQVTIWLQFDMAY